MTSVTGGDFVDNKTLRILKKVYHYENYEFDSEKEISIYSEDILTVEEKQVLQKNNIEINRIECFTHDETVTKLIKIVENPNLSFERVIDSFVAGIGGSYRRGLQPLMSYLYARKLQPHTFKESGNDGYKSYGSNLLEDGVTTCKYCGITEKEEWKNTSYEIYCMYLGNACIELPRDCLIDLSEYISQDYVYSTREDKAVFTQLINSLKNSLPNETSGKYEKRLTFEKIIPKANGYVKRSMLSILAEIGVIPNTIQLSSLNNFIPFDERCRNQKLLKTSHRSDIILPWAGWNGSLGINEDVLYEVFGKYLDV